MAEFNVGDVVYLKSGSPPMTVGAEADEGDDDDFDDDVFEEAYANIRCQWFDGKKLEEGYFKAGQLTKEKPKADA